MPPPMPTPTCVPTREVTDAEMLRYLIIRPMPDKIHSSTRGDKVFVPLNILYRDTSQDSRRRGREEEDIGDASC